MSRLDRHVALVRNKLALSRFLYGLAWAVLIYLALLWVGIMVDRVAGVRPPHARIWVLGGLGLAVVAAVVYAVLRRPSAHEAAVAIDERLALKEKFSTALYVRPLDDPFAQAAVRDAERTAENVSLHKRFPLQFPRASLGTAAMALATLLTFLLVPAMDLFGHEKALTKHPEQSQEVAQTKKEVERLLAVVNATPHGSVNEEAIKQAQRDLKALLNQPIRDTDRTKRSAASALADLDQAIKQQMQSNQKIADAQNDAKAFKSLTPGSDEKGPVADAQRKIAQGKFGDAVEDLKHAVDKFDKMNDEEKKKAAEQMKQMANQLQKMAQNNPQAQQQMQQQMQQMGMNQQQAQQAAKMMQQAAQGDKQAAQQLQQMAQQAMQNMTPKQKQTAQQMMKQAQAQAKTQAQAQQMQQAAQQMAQAMQQAAQQQQGGQKGNQQGQQSGQQMAQGMQSMQQQLQQMQAMKADAQQTAAAQQAMQQAAADAADSLNGKGGGRQQDPKGGQWAGNHQGQWSNNNNREFNGPNNGMGGGGIGAGDRTFKEQAPYQTKAEMDPTQDIEGGKILASTFVKAQTLKGQSTVGQVAVAPPPEQDATDDVEQDRIGRAAQQAVKDYFRAWQKDAER